MCTLTIRIITHSIMAKSRYALLVIDNATGLIIMRTESCLLVKRTWPDSYDNFLAYGYRVVVAEVNQAVMIAGDEKKPIVRDITIMAQYSINRLRKGRSVNENSVCKISLLGGKRSHVFD
jgi:hypothetical protein